MKLNIGRFLTLALLLPWLSYTSYAQGVTHPDRDSLISDFRYLVRALEETHPDPFTAFGGRPYFLMEANKVTKKLMSMDSCSIEVFGTMANAFVRKMQDGHTSIQSGNVWKNNPSFVPIAIKVIPDKSLIITALSKENKEYIGARILKINGVSVDSVLTLMTPFVSAENDFGKLKTLTNTIHIYSFYQNLFGSVPEQISFEILPYAKKANKRRAATLTLSFISWEETKTKQMEKCPDTLKFDNSMYQVRFLDKEKQVMLFKNTDIVGRENFVKSFRAGEPGTYDMLKYVYSALLKKEMPADTMEAVYALPSFQEEFSKALLAMKEAGSRVLIIDLRGNSGGWTPITLPTLYMLYGDKYIESLRSGEGQISFSKYLSSLYLKKINATLEDMRRYYGRDYRLGDLIENERIRDNATVEEVRDSYIKWRWTTNDMDALLEQEGKPIYSPEKVYVVTDPGTFSAAFHYAFYLWNQGAIVVGVPSSQAPNTFMEVTQFELPYTHIKGGISNSLQYCFPPSDPRAKVFWPDDMPSYEDYARQGFDKNAELLYLLDKVLNHGK